ncbi:MAG: hypothetical protein U1G07_05220 [Verrucomicrobiota bacterium]
MGTPVTPEGQDRKALAVFAEAVEIADPAAQHRYLDAACNGDVSLRQRVQVLLAGHLNDTFLEQPAASCGDRGPLAQAKLRRRHRSGAHSR